jgi:hypothetical protein
MIRIEGIPIVAARLVDAQNAKSTQTRNKRRKTSKIDAGVKAPLAIQGKMKVA